jgi:hypothetical protein
LPTRAGRGPRGRADLGPGGRQIRLGRAWPEE